MMRPLARRRILARLAFLSLPACLLLSGCGTPSAPDGPEVAAGTPRDDGGPALELLPGLSEAPHLVLDARMRVRFLPKATASGAPSAPPALRAMIMSAPGSVTAAFTVMGLTAWRIAWTADGIRESRHPKLDARISASKMLRDLALVHWPAAALRALLPAGCSLTEADDGGRRIERNGSTILRVAVRRGDRLHRILLENPVEGYVLEIDETA